LEITGFNLYLQYLIPIISKVIDLSTTAPLFFKEGWGEILQSVIKIPLYPPLQKGELEGDFLKSKTWAYIIKIQFPRGL
jgi:hypothetical protein